MHLVTYSGVREHIITIRLTTSAEITVLRDAIDYGRDCRGLSPSVRLNVNLLVARATDLEELPELIHQLHAPEGLTADAAQVVAALRGLIGTKPASSLRAEDLEWQTQQRNARAFAACEELIRGAGLPGRDANDSAQHAIDLARQALGLDALDKPLKYAPKVTLCALCETSKNLGYPTCNAHREVSSHG